MSLNTLYHIILKIDFTNNNEMLYVNGELIETKNITLSSDNNFSNYLWIGESSNNGTSWSGNNFFKGSIDDLRIYNYLLSQDNINYLYRTRGQEASNGTTGIAGTSTKYFGTRSWTSTEISGTFTIGYSASWANRISIATKTGDLLLLDVTNTTDNSKLTYILEVTAGAMANANPTAKIVSITKDGAKGDTGVGVISFTELYYLHTSNSSAPTVPTSHITDATGGAGKWTTKSPTWVNGKYFWTCTEVLYDDNTYKWTTPLLADGINTANSTANQANTTANTANETANAAQSTANQANTTATAANTAATNANTKIDNLEIGGRNLILNSNFSKNDVSKYGRDGVPESLTIVDDSTYGKCLKIRFDGTGNKRIYYNTNNIWIANQKYAVSFMVKTSDEGVTIKASRSMQNYAEAMNVTSDWTRYTKIINCTETVPTGTLTISVNKACTIYITLIKLEKGNKCTDWTPAPEDTDAAINSVNTYINEQVGILQDQIDGAIQFWNGSVIPTLNNYPASDWTTEAERLNHQADIYTVIQDVEGTLKQGKGYRFDKVNGTWTWVEITDNELSAVQALAESKAKVYVTQPTVPYKVGDLWLKDNELYKCKTAKTTGQSYALADWEKATKYTDDSYAEGVEDKLDEYIAKREIVVGTQIATTRFWTGVANLNELQDGDEILYWLPYATVKGAAGDKTTGVNMRVDSSTTKTAGTQISTFENSDQTKVWLNLTLKDGSTTGWIPCYYGGSSRLTTHYGAGNCIRLIYRVNANVNGTQYTGWFGDANYYSDSNTYDRVKFGNVIKVKSTITAGQLIVSDSSGYFKLVAGSIFNINQPILYCGTTKNAGATDANNNYLAMPSVDIQKNIASWTGTQYETLYLVGQLNGNTFTVDSTTPFTTTKPTFSDDKYYISLGYMYGTHSIYLYPEHPIFKYVNGGFKNISQIAYEAQATANTANDKIDNLEVGGRNLVPNSIYICDSNIGDNILLGIGLKSIYVKPGEEYTLTQYYNDKNTRSSLTNGYSYAHAYDAAGNKISNEYMNSFSNPTKIIDNNIARLDVYIGGIKNCNIGDVYKVKLEKGNKSTDWSPAPEDTSEKISNINSKLSRIESDLNNANFAVEKLQAMIELFCSTGSEQSILTQTEKGWEFNMKKFNDADKENADNLGRVGNQLNNENISYVEIGTNADGQPSILLGQSTSNYKVAISNTEIQFMVTNPTTGISSKVAYLDNNTFISNNLSSKNTIKIGEAPNTYIWQVRPNGNLGLKMIE